MPFALDNQTMIYIIIGIAVIEFFVCKYFVRHVMETEIQKNNKKILKKVTDQITTTFRQYVNVNDDKIRPDEYTQKKINAKQRQADSVDDPINEENDTNE